MTVHVPPCLFTLSSCPHTTFSLSLLPPAWSGLCGNVQFWRRTNADQSEAGLPHAMTGSLNPLYIVMLCSILKCCTLLGHLCLHTCSLHGPGYEFLISLFLCIPCWNVYKITNIYLCIYIIIIIIIMRTQFYQKTVKHDLHVYMHEYSIQSLLTLQIHDCTFISLWSLHDITIRVSPVSLCYITSSSRAITKCTPSLATK